MAKRIGGFRRKSRHKMTKERRQKGKVSLSRFFQSFSEGDRVFLCAEPAVHKGLCPPKYLGKTGTISGKEGSCYKVSIQDFGKPKILIVHPVHLKRGGTNGRD